MSSEIYMNDSRIRIKRVLLINTREDAVKKTEAHTSAVTNFAIYQINIYRAIFL